MSSPADLYPDVIEVAHREPVVLGVVAVAPASESSSLFVVLPGYSTQASYEVPAGNWSPRGLALPAVGNPCVLIFDENGEGWVPIWHGFTTFPVPPTSDDVLARLHPFLLLGG